MLRKKKKGGKVEFDVPWLQTSAWHGMTWSSQDEEPAAVGSAAPPAPVPKEEATSQSEMDGLPYLCSNDQQIDIEY